MGKQFKPSFSNPEEQPSKKPPFSSMPDQTALLNSPSASISPIPDQKTLKLPSAPSAPFQTAPNAMPSQGSMQGQYSQPGTRPLPSGQLFHGTGQLGETQTKQPFAGQPGNYRFGNPQSGMLNNSFVGVSQPPSRPGMSSGPQEMAGMGGSMAPHPTYAPASQFTEKPPVHNRKQNKRKKRRVPIWMRVTIGFLVLLLVLIGSAFTYYQLNYAPVLNKVTGQQFTRQHGEEDPNAGKTGSILNWGRVNILLLGSDTDEKSNWTGNLFLAQTVIVVSVDTSTHEVDMLSIPRDYYVPIPGYGQDKLDTAFAYGGSINNHMSGVGEVTATLDQDFGIKINFYAWVGLQGFIKVIDTVQGVDVNVTHPVVDDTYPDDVGTKGAAQSGYKRVYIPDGPQHLDGPTALEYVRSRHSTNDFDRSARQQQVLGALKLKLSNPSIFGDLPQIAQDLQGSVETSLSTTQLLDLGNFARGVQPDMIKHLTLGGSLYSTSATIAKGAGTTEDVIYPRCDTVPGAINTFLHIKTATCNIALRSGSLPPQRASSSGSGIGGMTAAPPSVTVAPLTEPGLGQDMPSFNDLFGMRDLLDVMAMVVLDSPQA